MGDSSKYQLQRAVIFKGATRPRRSLNLIFFNLDPTYFFFGSDSLDYAHHCKR